MSRFAHYTETMLLQSLREGHQGAFSEIYSRYYDDLRHTAYRYLSGNSKVEDASKAEDAVHEAFLSLWKYREKLSIDNLGGYLHQSVRNEAVRLFQKKVTDAEFRQQLTKAGVFLMHHSHVQEDIEYREALQDLINMLPIDHQAIYQLSRENDLTYQEIAEKLGISVKTVEKRMSASLKILREKFKQALSIFMSTLMTIAGINF